MQNPRKCVLHSGRCPPDNPKKTIPHRLWRSPLYTKGPSVLVPFRASPLHLHTSLPREGEPLPYTALVGFPINRRCGVPPPEGNEYPLRHGKAISSTVYTSLPCEKGKGGVFMHTKMLIRASSVSQHSSFLVIRRHPPFIPPSKGGQYILAFGKQAVHLRMRYPARM